MAGVNQKSLIVWAATLAVLLALLNLPLSAARGAKSAIREALAPLHALFQGAAIRAGETFSTLSGIGGLVGENRRMTEEIAILKGRVRELEAFERQNDELRGLLGFARASRRRLIPCEVIARDAGGWWQTLRVGRGSADGVEPDRAAVTPDGLAGRVISASPNTADVLLLSDPNCRVSARIVRNGAFGVVSGQGAGFSGPLVCRMDFINRNHPVRPGDVVVTSGLGGIFPPELPIGAVDRVTLDDSGLYQRAEILPRADLGRLRYVFVVVTEPRPGESPPAPSAAAGAPAGEGDAP